MLERRKSERVNLSTIVEYEKIDNGKAPGKFGAKNISVGGICLIVDESIKTGDKLSLKVKLTEKKTIHVKGKVIRIEGREDKKYEASIEFFEISDQGIEDIKNYVFLSYLKDKNSQ